MKKKISVTIGIPAYNEEENIGYLIKDILSQNQDSILIDKIIVASDGSNDKTIEIARNFESETIQIIDNKKRKGLATRENQIIKNTVSDALVLLNSDIRINDFRFLEKLILPISLGKADLTSPHTQEIRPGEVFEKVLLVSMKIKDFVYEKFNKGKNVYTCHGQARAFSKNLYKKIYFPSSIGNDAYSYFYCMNNGFKYEYVKNAYIVYKLPENFPDHSRQSVRFFQSKKLLSRIFNEDFVRSEYRIPKSIIIEGLLRMSIKYPIYISLYLFLVLYLKIKSYFAREVNNTWEIAVSSKRIKNNKI